MAIREMYDENGMLRKDQLEHVLQLFAIEMNSLGGCYAHMFHLMYKLEKIESPSLKELYEPNILLEIHAISFSMAKLYRDVFFRNAKNLYEFFYQTSGFEKNAFYVRQFPIDKRKFFKKRVKEQLLKNALRNKKKNALEIIEMMYQNKDAFLESLTVKVKKPKFERICLEHYKKEEADLRKIKGDC